MVIQGKIFSAPGFQILEYPLVFKLVYGTSYPVSAIIMGYNIMRVEGR